MMLSLEGVGDDAPPSLPVYLSSHQRRQRNVTGRSGILIFREDDKAGKSEKDDAKVTSTKLFFC
jgi:hypothetical protein